MEKKAPLPKKAKKPLSLLGPKKVEKCPGKVAPVKSVLLSQIQKFGTQKGPTKSKVETLKDATAHAEMLAFTAAPNYLGSKYLKDCTLYVTLEPCQMCAGAAYWSQLGRIVYSASARKTRLFSLEFLKYIPKPK